MVLPFLAAAAPFAPLIGGLISGIGALFAPKPEPVVVENKTDLVGMRAEAERAGFNPVSVLRAGAWSGFSRSTQTGGVSHNPFGDFLGHVGNGISNFSWDGGLGAERTRAEIGLMKAQTKSFSVPFASSGSGQRVTGGAGWIASPVVGGGMNVKNPDLAQKAEDNFGGVIGEIYGIGNWWDSYIATRPNSPEADFLKWGMDRYKMPALRIPGVGVTGGGF